MKTIFLVFIGAIVMTFANGQINLNNIKKEIDKATGNKSLSNDEVIKGLKEALTVGTNNSTAKASKTDGFFRNAAIKILFPPEAKDMERTLRSVGMGPQVDQFILTLNRAAEDASKSAAPIFINAITKMTIADGLSILRGGDNAATNYLKSSTQAQLVTAFKPTVKNSLSKVQITKYWNPLAKRYNKIPMVRKVNPNLEEYVTNKAIEGLFKLIAEEEYKIRKDPLARVTEILKKVFGSG